MKRALTLAEAATLRPTLDDEMERAFQRGESVEMARCAECADLLTPEQFQRHQCSTHPRE